jgi:hypothetical protein
MDTDNVDLIAQVCHDSNRAYALATGEDPAKVWSTWDLAPEAIKESSRVGVRKALEGATPRELHQSWCATKQADGWTYGETRDNDRKIHPCLCAYDLLPEAQRVKDSLFGAIVSALS